MEYWSCRRRSNVHPVEERRLGAADASRAVSRLLEVFGDIILPRLNENCVVVGVAVIRSQSLAHLGPLLVGMLPLAASASEALDNGRKKKMLST